MSLLLVSLILCQGTITQGVAAPPVAFNHFYVTVEPKTYRAIRDSKWLRKEFGDVVEQSTKTPKDSWSGLYVYGIGTYIEIFSADKQHREGKSGLGFLTTLPGGVDNAYARLQARFYGRAARELEFLSEGPEAKPWFHSASYKASTKSNFEAWLMEYYSEANLGANLPSEAERFANYRKQVKSKYRGLMGDVKRLTVRLSPADQADLETMLEALGFTQAAPRVYRRESDTVVLAKPLDGAPGWSLSEATFSLARRPKKDDVQRFGPNCVLTVRTDGTATWRFR